MEIVRNITLNIAEFHKKYIKDSALKNRITSFNYKEIEDGNNLHLEVVEDWNTTDDNNLDTLVANLVGFDAVLVKKQQYNKFKGDGWDIYNEMRANLLVKLESAQITPQTLLVIESKIEKAKNYLISGDIVSARNYVSAQAIDADFTQSYKDEILLVLQTYIEANYNPIYW